MKKAIVITGILILVLTLTVSARGNGKGRGNSQQSINGYGLQDGSCITTSDDDFTPGAGNGQGQRKGKNNSNGQAMLQGNGNGGNNNSGNGIQRQSRLFYSDEKVREASILKYDSDKNGTLDQSELLKMREEHNKIKDEFDVNNDGRLSDEEFAKYKDALYKNLGI